MSAVALMLLRLPVGTLANSRMRDNLDGCRELSRSCFGCVRASKSDVRNSETALSELKKCNTAIRKTDPRHLNALAVYLSETAPCSDEYTILLR